MKAIGTAPLSQREQLQLILLSGLAALPHVLHLVPWISAFFILLLGLRLGALLRPGLLPGRLLLFLLTLLGLGNVVLHHPLLLGREAGVALLVSMLALKLMEMRQRRDGYLLIFLNYFVLVTLFLYQQQPLIVLYGFLITVGLTAMLVEGSRARPAPRRYTSLGSAFFLLLQALPIMLVLFIFFPRFSSPLWGLGTQQLSAITGISDRITPGSVSRLSRSRSVAFRVSFEQAPPPPALRYWRGPVFWDTDGLNWTADEPGTTEPRLIPLDEPVDYEITLEPAPGRWLYALDLPLQSPPDSRLSADFQLRRKQPVKQRIRYQARSVLRYRTGPLSAGERQRALQLPDNVTSRMRMLVAEWRRQSTDDAELVARSLDYFRNQAFFYTLYPPLLGSNPTDQFLFESKRGFCEHFATSFTLLMRIAGIPARLVAGYQGGEMNPMGEYLIVRQSDAHAWSEVWLAERGWVRIDPTAAVAPERIERPLDPALISDRIGAPISFDITESSLLRHVGRQLALGLDALSTSWQRWVLGYSRERQSQLMQLLGLGFLRGPWLAAGMVLTAALVILSISLYLMQAGAAPVDPARRLYDRFCRRLARRGIPRKPHEGPLDYATRASAALPAARHQITAISDLYIDIRYGGKEDGKGLQRLRRLVRVFRP